MNVQQMTKIRSMGLYNMIVSMQKGSAKATPIKAKVKTIEKIICNIQTLMAANQTGR